MPRKPASAIAVVPTGVRRLRPPADLAADSPERKLFIDLVASLPASHFRESDEPLLSAYVRAVCRERTAAGELAAGGYVTTDGKTSPWMRVLKDATRDMTVISRLLRLNPVGRLQSSSSEPDQISSYYERMSLLESRSDDEPNN
jgi:phage terminase small subunit